MLTAQKTNSQFVSTELDLVKKTYGDKLIDFNKTFIQLAQQVQDKLKNANQDSTRLEYFKWLDLDYLDQINESQTKASAKKFKDQGFKNALVVGMGGSGINSLVLNNALSEYNPNRESEINLLIQNNLDPSSLLAKLTKIKNELDKTIFIIISKSGGTDEVRRNLNTILDFWQKECGCNETKLLETFAKQAVFITEPAREGKKNFLHELKNSIKEKTDIEIEFLENDPNIGGRFSMFSPVGMFTAELLGLNSSELLAGARECAEDFFAADLSEDIRKSKITELAVLDIFMFRNGIQNRYSMVYADALEALNKFRAQLKGESLNKDGIDSTVHIPGTGTVNHHSDLELLLKKDNKLVLEQVFFSKPFADHINSQDNELFADLLDGSNHQSLIDNHVNPLADYLHENNAAIIKTAIIEQNEKSIAYFLMQDMLVTVVQAGLQDELGSTEKLDLAIRQWEVEKYKKSVKERKN